MSDAATMFEDIKRTRAQYVAGEIEHAEYRARQRSTWGHAWRIGVHDDLDVIMRRAGLSPWGRELEEAGP